MALPAAVMVIAGALIGLSVPTWFQGAQPFGPRIGELVPVPTAQPPAGDVPDLCHQAYMQGTLERDAEHGFVVANGDRRTPVRWPHGYVAREGTDGLELLNDSAQVVGREGDFVVMGGGGNDMWLACPDFEVIPPEFTRRASDIEIAGIQLTLPPGWDARRPENPPFGAPHIIASWDYFWTSNQPMQSDCVEQSDGTLCRSDLVIPELEAGGVLIQWEVTTFMSPSPDRVLPSGSPTSIGGYPATLAEGGCESWPNADYTSHVQVAVGSLTTLQIRICGRELGERQESEIEAILQSIQFTAPIQ